MPQKTKKNKKIGQDETETGLVGAMKGTGLGSGQFLWICCCCFCLLCVAAILGVIGFALIVDLLGDVSEHHFCLDLTGCKEKPVGGGNPPDCSGDSNGVGWARVTVREGKDVCVDIIIENIGLPVMGMHIHGPLTVDDPLNAGIFVPEDGTSSFDVVPDDSGAGIQIKDCQPISSATSDAILNNPQLFYLNVHNAGFPEGALRDLLGNGCSDF